MARHCNGHHAAIVGEQKTLSLQSIAEVFP
jgi:hypothetical protein